MTDDKSSTGAGDQLGVEIAATMRDHEQSTSVDRIIAAVTSGTDRSRRRGSVTPHRQRSAVWFAAAAVVLLAGVTGLVVAGTSRRATVPPVTPPPPPVVTALEGSVVHPGDQVVAEGLGGIASAGDDSLELCSMLIGPATSQSPGPADSDARPGSGCAESGGIKIATLKPSGSLTLKADHTRSVQVTGIYRADGSIAVSKVETAFVLQRPEDRSMTTPCPTPTGGWRLRDGDAAALNTLLNQHPDGYLTRGTSPEGKDYNVIAVGTVSQDLVATRKQLEKIYGAPVCVYRARHSQKQLGDATSAAGSILRSHQDQLYPGPTNVTSASLPLAPDSDTLIGYTRIITPTLAEQLAPFGELITFVPFIKPLDNPSSTRTTSSDMTSTSPVVTSEPAPETGVVESLTSGFADPGEVATPIITDWTGDAITPSTVSAAWLRTSNRLVMTTFGSGSCPLVIQQVTLVGPQEISLAIVDTQNGPLASVPSGRPSDSGTFSYPRDCTRDIRPYTMIVRPPPGVTSDVPLVIHGGGASITLPARTGKTSTIPSASATPTSVTPSTTRPTTTRPGFALPTFTGLLPGEVMPEARAVGVLTRGSDGCLHLGPDGPVAFWPPGSSAVLEQSGVVRVLRNGYEVVRTGQTLDVTGGSFDPLPAGCSSGAGTFRVYLLQVTS
ncbi:MAG: hypothetical protein WKF57_11330 [Nakamurella sp.]